MKNHHEVSVHTATMFATEVEKKAFTNPDSFTHVMQWRYEYKILLDSLEESSSGTKIPKRK